MSDMDRLELQTIYMMTYKIRLMFVEECYKRYCCSLVSVDINTQILSVISDCGITQDDVAFQRIDIIKQKFNRYNNLKSLIMF